MVNIKDWLALPFLQLNYRKIFKVVGRELFHVGLYEENSFQVTFHATRYSFIGVRQIVHESNKPFQHHT